MNDETINHVPAPLSFELGVELSIVQMLLNEPRDEISIQAFAALTTRFERYEREAKALEDRIEELEKNF